MNRGVVTGCAGFIGSHLAERLVADGYRVLGVDAFTPYYPRADKTANPSALSHEPRFELVELDLAEASLVPAFAGAVRRHEADMRAARARLPAPRSRRRRAALLHGVRSTAAAGHGAAEAVRRAARGDGLPALWRRLVVARLHLRRGRRRRHRPRRARRPPHAVYSVGGGEEATLADVIAPVESLAGRSVALERRERQPGDVRRTGADTSLARSTLGWRPATSLRDGLRSELEWAGAHWPTQVRPAA